MDGMTIVYVYSIRKRIFVATPAYRVVCPECGRKYDQANDVADNDDCPMWWDEVILGEPHLQCECGEQFSTRNLDD